MTYQIKRNDPVKTVQASNGKEIRLPLRVMYQNKTLGDCRCLGEARAQISSHRVRKAQDKLHQLEIKALESMEWGL